MKRTLMCLGASFIAANTSALAQDVGINGDPCAYTSIPDAVAAASAGDVIYVTGGTTYPVGGGLSVDVDLDFLSAESDCGAASSDLVTLDSGGGAVRAVEVDLGAVASFTNFVFQNGDVAGDGGLVSVEGEGALLLHDCILEDSVATGMGGAIYVNDGSVTLTGATRVEDNEAVRGGGISVEAGFLFMEDDAIVRRNVASSSAGGVSGRGSFVILQDSARVSNNDAELSSGGIAVLGGGVLWMGPDTEVSFNTVTGFGYGGGILLSGGNHTIDGTIRGNEAWRNGGAVVTAPVHETVNLSMTGARIRGNVSRDEGSGSIYVDKATATLLDTRVNYNDGYAIVVVNSTFTMDVVDGACDPTTLPLGRHCSEIRGNSAVGMSVFTASSGSDVRIEHTAFVDNSGVAAAVNFGGATVIDPTTSDAMLIRNSLFAQNTVDHVLIAYDDANLDVRSSTIADNTTSEGAALWEEDTTGDLRRSIVWNSGDVEVVVRTLDVQCSNITDVVGTYTGVNALVPGTDPLFAAGSFSPYQLGAASPSASACAVGPSDDLVERSRSGGTYDMGAFEDQVN